MTDISHKLIKNGINALLEDNEPYFKKNLVQSLSIKLNNALSDVIDESYKNLFYTQEVNESTKDLKVFLEVLESPGKIQLKDGSIINITEFEVKALKELFDNIGQKSKKLMTENVFDSSNSLKQHLDFYQKSKGLFR
jgi:hypothetical protein